MATSGAGATSVAPGDWAALDYLSGEVDVDVHLEVALPVVGVRRATHRLRVPIDDGIIDHRALERNLSKLENALLDFSVRKEGLALERVNPFYPVRGHGKPIIVWHLSPEDRALAEREHVRLAILPAFTLTGVAGVAGEAHAAGVAGEAHAAGVTGEAHAAGVTGEAHAAGVTGEAHAAGAADAAGAAEPSSIQLHRLDLLGIVARLSLAGVETPLLGTFRPRHLELLELRGDLHSRGPGTIAADVTGLALGVNDLSVPGLGDMSIDLVTAAAIKPISLGFTDLRPTELHLTLTGLSLDTLASARKTH